MPLPTPKYEIGDTFYIPRTDYTTETLPCPDCKGTKEWKITTPMGEEFEMPCGTCGYRNQTNTRTVHKGFTQSLTVGSVRIDTNESERSPVSYMAYETGVGSGSIYFENRTYDSDGEAMVIAVADAKRMTEKLRERLPLTRKKFMDNPIGDRVRQLESHVSWDMCEKREAKESIEHLESKVLELQNDLETALNNEE